jgi:hypothetical protein
MVQITIASGSSLILYFMPSTVELVLQIIIGETGMKAAWNQVSEIFSLQIRLLVNLLTSRRHPTTRAFQAALS